MVLEKEFCDRWLNLGDFTEMANMYNANNLKPWHMIIRNPHCIRNSWVVTEGWKEFSKDNELEIGDTLKFTLRSQPRAKMTRFEVTITRHAELVNLPAVPPVNLQLIPQLIPRLMPQLIPRLILNLFTKIHNKYLLSSSYLVKYILSVHC